MIKVKVGQILNRVKETIIIEDECEYKRLTIRMFHKGVCLRDTELGVNIGTKNQFIARSGQFIMSRIDARNGAFGIIPASIGHAAITNDFLSFTVNERLVNIDYFKLYSQTDSFMKLCIEGSKGTTNRKRLKEDLFLDFEVCLPELQEQFQVVEQIKKLQILKETLDSDLQFQYKSIHHLRQSILREAIQGKLVPQDPNDERASILLKKLYCQKESLIREKKIKKEKSLPQINEEEIPYELPQGWEWVRLASIAIKLGAGSTPTGGKKVYLDKGIKFIRSQNVWNDGLKTDDIVFISEEINNKMRGSQVKANDILLNITGASIGRSCVVEEQFDMANVNQHVSIIRLIDPRLNSYIHKCIISPYIQNLIMDVQVGVSREGLSMEKLGKFLIPIPPLNEQKRIVEMVDQLFALCDQLENEVKKSMRESEILIQSVLQEKFRTTNKEDNIIEVPPANFTDIEEWEFAARSGGEITSDTKTKIKNKVAELLGKSQQ